MTIEELKEKIRNDNPYFKNREIKDYQVYDLLDFNVEKANCKKCNGIENCLNSKRGFEPIIDEDNNIAYVRCRYMKNELNKALRNQKLNAQYMPQKLLEANFNNFRLDNDKRIKCMQFAKKFIDSLKNNDYAKGAYIYGDIGQGKTYFLAALANELADHNHDVTFVYFPDLINDLKDDFDKLNNKINELKQTEILIIDDFGVGNMTGWVRDSIVAPILNYRMSDLKPVFISSNVIARDLDTYLKVKEDRDDIPASRIIRRVVELCDFLEM
ncbi:MAG: ATP-binding protein [Acholeplasmatales bacterium]|nr:ATP-binding protein [Acholeplasmatales bacterium]